MSHKGKKDKKVPKAAGAFGPIIDMLSEQDTLGLEQMTANMKTLQEQEAEALQSAPGRSEPGEEQLPGFHLPMPPIKEEEPAPPEGVKVMTIELDPNNAGSDYALSKIKEVFDHLATDGVLAPATPVLVDGVVRVEYTPIPVWSSRGSPSEEDRTEEQPLEETSFFSRLQEPVTLYTIFEVPMPISLSELGISMEQIKREITSKRDFFFNSTISLERKVYSLLDLSERGIKVKRGLDEPL